MGKINRKAVKAVKTKGAAPAAADNKASSKVSKRSVDVIPLGAVKKTTTKASSVKLRKKDRVKVKKQHLLLKLQVMSFSSGHFLDHANFIL